MVRIVLSLFFIAYLLPLKAQIKVQYNDDNIPEKSQLKAVFHKGDWAIEYEVEQESTLFALAKRFHVPPAKLADINNVGYQKKLERGTIVYIPLGAYNQVTEDPKDDFNHKALFYDVKSGDNLFRIAHMAGVRQKEMQEWNGLNDNDISGKQRLFVGWVLFDAPAFSENTNGDDISEVVDKIPVNKKDFFNSDEYERVVQEKDGETIIVLRRKPKDTLSEIAKIYMDQTGNEEVINDEKGTGVFFDMKGKVQGVDVYYAFHNTARRGTIIKIHNPGTGKTVYAKVLGPLPNTKQYHGAIIGISSGAKDELLVPEDRTWCEVKYAPTL